jgi:dihydrofolate reductase
MGSVIVIQFVTIDGVAEDPDSAEGFPHGGWAFRYGPQAVAGDKFKLGELLNTGTLLLGRRTWQRFARIWPTRTDDFSVKMNRIPKLVASTTLARVDEWNNSCLLTEELVAAVTELKTRQDVIVAGSGSVIHTLVQHDLIDEYRLLVFPIVLGEGRRLFRDGAGPLDLRLARVEQSGEAALITYRRDRTAAARPSKSALAESSVS